MSRGICNTPCCDMPKMSNFFSVWEIVVVMIRGEMNDVPTAGRARLQFQNQTLMAVRPCNLIRAQVNEGVFLLEGIHHLFEGIDIERGKDPQSALFFRFGDDLGGGSFQKETPWIRSPASPSGARG